MWKFRIMRVFNRSYRMLGWSLICATMFFLKITFCFANVHSISEKKLQNLVDTFRAKSNATAAVLSINFPNNKIITLVSGTVEKITSITPNPPFVTSNNLFQIGSITKSFTAAIILQLEAEGKLSINDTIFDMTKKYGQWLPNNEYQAWKNISIKQLLNMTSGIFNYTEDKGFMNALAMYPEKNWSSQEIIKHSYKNKSYFPAGKGWHYSNVNYNILGLLIEKITKHSFEYEINQRILKKYSLNNTYYFPYEYPDNIKKRVTHGYVYRNGGFSPPMKSGSDITKFNLSAAGPSGALISTSNDITRWVRLLFTGKVVPKSQLTEMMAAVCATKSKSCKPGESLSALSHSDGFSLGLARMHDPLLGIIWVYTGETPGYIASFIWLPKSQISLALTVNATTKVSNKILKSLVKAAKLVHK